MNGFRSSSVYDMQRFGQIGERSRVRQYQQMVRRLPPLQNPANTLNSNSNESKLIQNEEDKVVIKKQEDSLAR